jgi:Flp pilus assembly protein TadD
MATKSRLEQIQDLLRAEPDDPELRYFLAMEHISAGHDEEGARHLDELVRVRPDYIPAYLQAGQVLARLGREEEARTFFQRGITQAEAKGDTHAAGEMAGFLDGLS